MADRWLHLKKIAVFAVIVLAAACFVMALQWVDHHILKLQPCKQEVQK